MTYGFKIVQEMISGLSQFMDDKGITSVDQIVGRAVPKAKDWQDLNLNYTTKAVIDQDLCIKCGRCYASCEDTCHQAIAMSDDRVFTAKDEKCVACNLCVNVCPVEGCITMKELPQGAIDTRTGKTVEAYANWTTHPNNPMSDQPNGRATFRLASRAGFWQVQRMLETREKTLTRVQIKNRKAILEAALDVQGILATRFS